ncbi:MAG: DNA recombination protein RmuC [Pseudomonadota bacterium]
MPSGTSLTVQIGSIGLDGLHLALGALLLVTGLILVWVQARSRAGLRVLGAEKAHLEEQLARMSAQVASMEDRLRETTDRATVAERDLAVANMRAEEARQHFASMAQDAVRAAHESFSRQANETFARQSEAAEANLKMLLAPIGGTFEAFQARVDALERTRTEDRTAIFEQVKAISAQLAETRRATGKLATVLSSPRGGGRWGEESLRNVLEMAGLSPHADFIEQASGDVDGKSQRPDVIIRMPGGREIVIDAKVTVEDFLRASEAAEPSERDAFLVGHARKMRDHVKRLAAKAYWRDFADRVDFVAMYVPGENFYAAALQQDRSLFDFAARNRVLIVTPSTLIALAKAVAYGWRQEEAAGHAREAAHLGRDLYDALRSMAGHIEKVGQGLGGAVSSYNAMVGSLERNVLPKARRFETLQITQSGVPPLEGPSIVEDPLRTLAPDDERPIGPANGRHDTG